MNIKWYKNIWYYLTIFIAIFIVSFAVLSVKNSDIAIVTSKKIVYFDLETIYRAIFNPLWIMALWTIDNGRKLNSERHKDILSNIQGVLYSTKGVTIRKKDIYDIVYKFENLSKKLEERLDKNDSVSSENNNPIV